MFNASGTVSFDLEISLGSLMDLPRRISMSSSDSASWSVRGHLCYETKNKNKQKEKKMSEENDLQRQKNQQQGGPSSYHERDED